ncbi:hypothetical protein ACUVMQ_21580, partial [Aeromonas veronii]|uniref:hypothetical protein n=1 Tax=Aeromonas veronii TaxID=654 RepID=UPI00405594F9
MQVNPGVGVPLKVGLTTQYVSANTTDDFKSLFSLSGGNGGKLTFTSGDTSVVDIDSDGLMAFKKLGKVALTVTESGNDNYVSQSLTVTVAVSMQYGVDATVTGTCNLEADGTGAIMTVWSKYSTRVDLNPYTGTAIDYKISKVINLEAGQTVTNTFDKIPLVLSNIKSIIATTRTPEGGYIGETRIDCKNRSTGTSLTASNIIVTQGDAPTKPDLSGGNGGALNYASNNTSVVSIDTDGTMTFVNPGTAIITVNEAGGVYLPQSTSFSVTVLPAVGNALVVPSSNIQMDVLSSQQILVSGGNGGSISYVTDDDSIVTVDANG